MRKLVYQIKSLFNYFKWFLKINKYLFNNNELRIYQIDKINNQIKNAFDNNNFYKNHFLKNGINSEFRIRTLNDITNLPVLKKKDFKIAAAQKNIISKNYNINDLVLHYTTGSTGNPTQIYSYKQLEDIRGQVLNRVWFNSGKISFKRILKVWRSKSPTSDEEKRIKFGLLRNYEILDFDNIKLISDSNREISNVYKFNPNVIRGYVSALYDLGKKVQFKKIKSLEVVIASAEYLPSIIWTKLEDMFKVPIINLYGGTEAPAIAQSSMKSKNMVINEDLYFIELLDNNYNTAKPGQIAKIIVTDLHNEAFPLIRYEIGDLAIAGSDFFSYNENIRYFLSVEGRSNDIFVFDDGSILYSHFWHIIFREETWIDTFQVIQFDKNKVKINLKLTEINIDKLDKLKFLLKEKLPLIEIDYFIVDKIPLGPGGKELAIYSLVSTEFNNTN